MARFPDFSIIYTGVDVSADLQPFLMSLRVEDNLSGESDQLSITLDNRDNRWLNVWMPSESDVIEVAFGYRDGAMSAVVAYEVDRLRWRGVPDTVEIGALATPISRSLREIRSQAYENTSLTSIANEIAIRHDLTVVGDIPEIKFKRVTQKRESDLGFLRRLAEDYGLSFKIESLSLLVFFRELSLEEASPVAILRKSGIDGYSISRESAGTYQQAKIAYQDPESGDFIDITVGLDGEDVPKPTKEEEGEIKASDTLNIRERVESVAIARVRAVEALRRENKERVELRLSLAGDPLLSAGSTLMVIGFGRMTGKYLITQATHAQAPTYTTSLRCRKVIGADN